MAVTAARQPADYIGASNGGAAHMTKPEAPPAKPSEELSDEDLDRVAGGIIIYDYVGQPVARYHLENAWPAK
jgi:hypothetical protein